MNGRRAAIGLVASAAALGLLACGGYPSAEEPSRAPETCSGSEAVPACTERLQRYERALQATLPETRAREGEVDNLQSAAPAQPSAAAEQSVQSAEAEELAEQGAPAPSGGPDCSAARDLRDRICELAAAICALARRPDAAEQTVNACNSGTLSCTRARAQVAGTCPE